ncbi:MAG: hypothetical protein IKN81_05480 [Oscillospiraceae bacterium]|nr:hypothetical protein [Oscillospiraceae bacterium]
MRIAVPTDGEACVAALTSCEAIKLYEDDHGRIVRTSIVPVSGDAQRAIERGGVDVLVCGELTAEERRALAEDGVLLTAGYRGSADACVRAYLGTAIACDPNNNCNYCGHKTECDLGQH